MDHLRDLTVSIGRKCFFFFLEAKGSFVYILMTSPPSTVISYVKTQRRRTQIKFDLTTIGHVSTVTRWDGTDGTYVSTI